MKVQMKLKIGMILLFFMLLVSCEKKCEVCSKDYVCTAYKTVGSTDFQVGQSWFSASNTTYPMNDLCEAEDVMEYTLGNRGIVADKIVCDCSF